jgi:hypothetical protein
LIAVDAGVGLQILLLFRDHQSCLSLDESTQRRGAYPFNSSDPEEDCLQSSLSWQVDQLRD